MNQEWVDKMNAKELEPFKDYPKAIVDFWKGIDDETQWTMGFEVGTTLDYLALLVKHNEPCEERIFLFAPLQCRTESWNLKREIDKMGAEEYLQSSVEQYKEAVCNLKKIGEMCSDYYNFLQKRIHYERYLDCEPMHFSGDIIITDPCYLHLDNRGNVRMTEHETIEGDWSCTTFNTDTHEPIGEFCADGGMVCVADLSDVLKCNPYFDYHTERPWTTTLIKDFEGDVQIKVREEKGVYEEDTKYWKKGEEWTVYICYVEGHGVNKVTGEPINFITG